MKKKIVEQYFFFGFLLAVMVFTVIIFRPFLTTIVIGASLSVVLFPLYRWISNHITHKVEWVASILTILVFIIVLCGPLFFLGSVVFKESQQAYQSVIMPGNTDTIIEKINTSINSRLPDGFSFDIHQRFADLITSLSGNIAKIFTATLQTLFTFLLVLLSMFYFLKDGPRWKRAIVAISPLSDKDDEKILTKLGHAVNGVIKGYLFIGLVQGTLVGIGFAIFGIPNAALFGVLAGIASLVPSVGTGLVAIPAILYLFAIGHAGAAIGLAIWSALLVGTIDNLLNPIVVGKNINVPPLLILFSVLGGISLMGPVGILIGPLTVSLLYALVSLYRHREIE